MQETKQATLTERREQRQSNFELLRIIAMFGIVLFHHFGNRTPNSFIVLQEGFKIDNYFYDIINNTTSQLSFRTLLLDYCYGHFGNGGNLIFMLLTGYFLYGKKLSLEKRVKSATEIIFLIMYGAIIMTVINAVSVKFYYPFAGCPSFKPTFDFPNWVSGSNLWYFQAYGVFILVVVPILKYFEPRIDRNTHKALIAMLVALCFFDYSNYLPNIWISKRILQFTMCYYIGGYVSKYPVKYSWKKLIISFIIYTLSYFVYEYYWRVRMRKMFAPPEYSYISVMQPFICCLIFALLLFLIFSKIHINSRIINHISSATPMIYLFHYNFVSYSYVIANTFWWKDWSIEGYCKFVLIDSLLLFALGYLIELLRKFLFSYLEKYIKQQRV